VISTSWLNARHPHWTRLDELLDAASRQGIRSLDHDELQELGLLYRQIGADLAMVREDPASARFEQYLDRLLARAHHTIYATERQRPVQAIRQFLLTYPALFQRQLLPCLVSAVIFLSGAALGAALAYRQPEFKTQFLGPRMIQTIERHEMWTHSIVGIKPLASSQIMTNNISVSLTTFAMGITAGVGTVYMLVFNGLLLGVIGVACGVAGMSVPLWSFVAPHGVLELPAIVIAGGAGLRVAHGLLFPGLLPRRQSVSRSGADAVRLVLGCVPILVVAGVIEAFVSPTDMPVGLKFAMAGALFVLLILYLFGPLTGDSAALRRDTRSPALATSSR
jgi:uncharacterized membrane protein SpoIIM required for sporulation